MRQVLWTLATLAGLAVLGAAAVIGFGLYNTSARGAHLPGIGWALHTTFKQSVRLRAPATEEVPADLRHPDRAALGALHYQNACAFCHGFPDAARPATAMAMNPRPPHVTEAVADWDARHMGWIVQEGVKMSGMPHWPAEGREDEVWSVVSYLMAIKEGTELPPRPASATCTACHGEDGDTTNAYIPRLDLLTPDQIAQALRHYRSGARESGIMAAVARDLEDAEIARAARAFGRSDPAPAPIPDPEAPAALLATRGTGDVPACTACHGPERDAEAPIAPVITGQNEGYLRAQLRLWRDGARGGGVRAELMRKAAQDLTDAEIDNLAAFFAGLAPAEP
ncbi:c-type cytochrome [Thalassorhabdomicrobium marinisediminis]|uniref:Class I triheme cytochrome c n=1 Tax=Thalassorhabdomicrobium marinisediminis TaxID=2170577 RepID=A0A2T7FTM8_9RHOB|nr:c-type cytochrome [Thalassorhabdomicrobium marinisediminis]PVA05527.1 class I triheme cytochrome c [Thalassorhabdomicrobium marinisediminis]